jgi:hypothetical protein
MTIAHGVWQRVRFGARLEISLGWRPPLVYRVGGTAVFDRSVLLAIVSSKQSEFVLASGKIEAMSLADREWIEVCQLSKALTLPVVVPPNRRWMRQLSGRSLASNMTTKIGCDSRIFLRATVEDLHRTELRSRLIECSIGELERQDVR